MKKPKNIPDFKTEEEERQFWESRDSADYFDLSKAKKAVFPNLKPTTEKISIRLPTKKTSPISRCMEEYLDRSVKAERRK